MVAVFQCRQLRRFGKPVAGREITDWRGGLLRLAGRSGHGGVARTLAGSLRRDRAEASRRQNSGNRTGGCTLRSAGEVRDQFRMAIECVWNPEVEPASHVEHIQVVSWFCELAPPGYSNCEHPLWVERRPSN